MNIPGPEPLVAETCCKCGIRFAMPRSFQSRCQNDSKVWFCCPNGHSQHYTGEETERQNLRRERDRLQQRLAQKDDEITSYKVQVNRAERSAAAHKGVATKIKKRVNAGSCPCCKRNFQNLARHMAGQHPNFVSDDSNVVPMREGAA